MSGRSIHLIDKTELLATLEQDIDVSVTGAENMEAVRKCLQEILDDVKESPVVDAVPVIRCKDCKFSKAYYHGSESNLGMFTYLCTQGLYGMNADDYCSRGERKEE